MLAIGLAVIVFMSVSLTLRLVTGAGWLWLGSSQLFNAWRAFTLVCRIRLHADGSAEIGDPSGAWRCATLGRGSVVLERVAWLRFDVDGGSQIAELLTGNPRKNKDWRRLQVIWRHLGSAT